MEDLQSALQGILSDPEQMARVAALAESLGLKPPDAPPEGEGPQGGAAPQPPSAAPKNAAEAPEPGAHSAALPFGLDAAELPALLSGLASMNGAEDRVLGALRASLSPASQPRIDKALRAAKLSRLAGRLLRERGEGRV